MARDGIAVVPSTTSDAAPLTEDDRIKTLTFTGSPAVDETHVVGEQPGGLRYAIEEMTEMKLLTFNRSSRN